MNNPKPANITINEKQLNRVIGPWLLTFYGLGTIIGAGIYVLIGEVAREAGYWMPLSFLLAGLIAAFTAFSYAELASRIPVSAGEAAYMQSAWGRKWLSGLVGWSIVLTGIVSAATITNGFVGYIGIFLHLPDFLAVVIFVFALGLVAIAGIRSSAWTIFAITLIGVGGLLYVVLLAQLADDFAFHPPTEPLTAALPGILLGSILAFYAFIGFEDMVNIIEEVDKPTRTFPLALLTALIVSIVIYMVVGISATGLVAPEILAESEAPMTTLVEAAGGSTSMMTIISLLAVINGALVQIIMGSRVLYGMGRQGMAPSVFGKVYSRTRTPAVSTVLATVLVMVFALLLPLASLARLTSILMLIVFTLVNLALLVLKHKSVRRASFHVPFLVPAVGALCSSLLVLYQCFSLI